MAEQLKVEDFNNAKDAFIKHGQITKAKFCTIIERFGLNKETVVSSKREIFVFSDFLMAMEKLKAEKSTDEIKESFTNNGYITKENVLSFINSRSNAAKEEVHIIIGNTEVSNYSYNRFISIMTCVHMLEVFKKFDKDCSGYITLHELRDFLESNSGTMWRIQETTHKIKKVDQNDDGKISFEEFARMMISDENSAKEKVKQAFKAFDVDGNGFVTPEEFKEVLSKSDGIYTVDEIDGIVKTADQDGDGKINFEEFIEVIDWDN